MSALRTLFGSQAVSYYPALARALGGVAPALLFGQVAYWSEKAKDGWAFRTTDQIEEWTALSYKAQATARRQLLELGAMEEYRGRGNRLHYRPVWARVEVLLQSSPNGNSKPPGGASLDLPDGQNLLIGSKERDKESYPLKGGVSDAAPTEDQGSYWMLRTVERLTDAGIALSHQRKQGHLSSWNALLRRGTPQVELERTVNRIVSRAAEDGGRILTPSDAHADVTGGKHVIEGRADPKDAEASRNRRTEGYEWFLGEGEEAS